MTDLAEQINIGERVVRNIQMHLMKLFRQKWPVRQIDGFSDVHRIKLFKPFPILCSKIKIPLMLTEPKPLGFIIRDHF